MTDELTALRDALAAANAHAEAQAERITYLEQQLAAQDGQHAADTERWTAQMAQLAGDISRLSHQHQSVWEAWNKETERADQAEYDLSHARLDVLTLKAKLYDIMAREGSGT